MPTSQINVVALNFDEWGNFWFENICKCDNDEQANQICNKLNNTRHNHAVEYIIVERWLP